MEGKKFGNLTVIKRNGTDKNKKAVWLCRCDCGNETNAITGSLKHKNRPKTHCGCKTKENKTKRWDDYRASDPFWGKVEKTETCWLWTGSKCRGGYGVHGGKYINEKRVHRHSWTLHNGEIQEGINVLHKCDVRNCVNPDHLFLGSHADNMKDMKIKGRRKGVNSGENNGRAKLNNKKADEIRELYKKGLSQQEIAVMYGVSQPQISKVIQNKRFV